MRGYIKEEISPVAKVLAKSLLNWENYTVCPITGEGLACECDLEKMKEYDRDATGDYYKWLGHIYLLSRIGQYITVRVIREADKEEIGYTVKGDFFTRIVK